MLKMNAADLSTNDLRDAVLAECSRFGCVSYVRVMTSPDYTAAMVRMSNTTETSELLESLGETMVGESVFIWIEHAVTRGTQSSVSR
jgi:hypothetical protein